MKHSFCKFRNTKKRMETIDDEVTKHALRFIDDAHKEDNLSSSGIDIQLGNAGSTTWPRQQAVSCILPIFSHIPRKCFLPLWLSDAVCSRSTALRIFNPIQLPSPRLFQTAVSRTFYQSAQLPHSMTQLLKTESHNFLDTKIIIKMISRGSRFRGHYLKVLLN